MSNDPYEDPRFRKWARRVREELVPKMKDCSVVASVVPDPDTVDAKFAVELGVSILLDKPIVALVRPGVKISEKLSRVVDRFVEVNPDNPGAASVGIRDAVQELTGESECTD